MSDTPLLQVRGLHKTFSSGRFFGRDQRRVAVSDVSFDVERGEAVAVVGESGSGKSTIARLLLRLEKADRGEIRLDGVDVLSVERGGASLAYRGRVQMVFQDPFGSLNPVHDVAHHVMRPIERHGRSGALNPARTLGGQVERPLARRFSLTKQELRERALELLRTVGLEPAEEMIERLPFELSGGQRQRVAIARALAVQPDLLVADEPTSMLDVSIRTGVLNLLLQLKRDQGLSIVLITHDLASARYLADRILVLYQGRVVEEGPSRELIEAPAHPYSRALLSAIADDAITQAAPAAGAGRKLGGLSGEQARVGCPFAPRCPEMMERCLAQEPPPVLLGASRRVRCFLYEDAA